MVHGISVADAEIRSVYGGYLLGRSQPHPMLRRLPDVERVPMRAGCSIEFQGLVTMLGAELDRQQPGSGSLTPSLADAAMTYILRTWLRHRAPDGTWVVPGSDAILAPALQVMHEQMKHPWTVAQLASVSGLSRAAFARRFTALIGRPPLAYLTELRLATAARLLRQTDDSIVRIAEAIGYGSQVALTRAFRREKGVTPSYYRRQDHGEA